MTWLLTAVLLAAWAEDPAPPDEPSPPHDEDVFDDELLLEEDLFDEDLPPEEPEDEGPPLTDDPITALTTLQWEHGARILVGVSGPEAVQLARRRARQLPPWDFAVVAVPIRGVAEREMALALERQGLSCGARLHWVYEEAAWQVDAHGDCAPVHERQAARAEGGRLTLVGGAEPGEWSIVEEGLGPIDTARFATLLWDATTTVHLQEARQTADRKRRRLRGAGIGCVVVGAILAADAGGREAARAEGMEQAALVSVGTGGMLLYSAARAQRWSKRVRAQPSAWYDREDAERRIQVYNAHLSREAEDEPTSDEEASP